MTSCFGETGKISGSPKTGHAIGESAAELACDMILACKAYFVQKTRSQPFYWSDFGQSQSPGLGGVCVQEVDPKMCRAEDTVGHSLQRPAAEEEESI